MPVKWTGPSLDIMSNQVATETLEVAYQEIIGLGALGGMLAGALSMSRQRERRVLRAAPMVMDAVGSAASAVGQALGLIKADEGQARRAWARTCPTAPHEIECMFNPTDYTLSQTVVRPARPPAPSRGRRPRSSTAAPAR